MTRRDQETGLAVCREVHVSGTERLAESAARRFFAHMLHVEGSLALALRQQHARVEGAERHHVAQAFEQFRIAQEAAPGPYCLSLAVEDADDRIGELTDRFGIGIDWRPRN